MVLLPKPPKESSKENDGDKIQRNVFFADDRMDMLAKHFVGNNYR